MKSRPSGMRQVVLLGLVFLVPLALATWLYYGGRAFAPSARTNTGTLLEPIVNLRQVLPNSQAATLSEEHWLVLYLDEGPCGAACEDALYVMRQTRLMLGREMTRVRRVFLHGEYPPDRVFIQREHPGLTTTRDGELARLLEERRPAELPPGGFYLVDPLGNLVMYFPPDIVPGDMVDDIEHLLEISHIG